MTTEDKFWMRTQDFNNWPHVEAGWNQRPSWKAWGTGRRRIKFYLLPGGSLEMEAIEIADPSKPDGKPHAKEVMISIPKEVVAELRRILA